MGHWNKKGKRNNKRGNNDGITCWYCGNKIRGRVKFWSSHPVHAGKCYKNCCKNLMTGKNLLKKFENSQPRKGFFARLFGW